MDIPVGAAAESTHLVGEQDTARSLGSGDVEALATPRLLAWLEQATCLAVDPHLPSTHTSVGTQVEISHLRASAIGASVSCRAQVSEVDGARVRLSVQAESMGQVVASGVVRRAVVDRAAFAALLVPPHWLSNLDRGVAEGWIVPPRRRGPMPRIQRFAASTSVAEILREDRDGDDDEER